MPAYAAAASQRRPAEVKARYFDEYLHSQTIQEDWIARKACVPSTPGTRVH